MRTQAGPETKEKCVQNPKLQRSCNRLADIIPDYDTREFLRGLALKYGYEVAAAFASAIIDGTLIDCGWVDDTTFQWPPNNAEKPLKPTVSRRLPKNIEEQLKLAV